MKKKGLDTIFGVPEILRVKTVFVKHWDENKPEEMANPLESFFFPSGTTLQAKGRLTWTVDDWTFIDRKLQRQLRVVSDDSPVRI